MRPIAKIKQMVESGMHCKQIAKELGIAYNTVRRHADKLGVVIPKKEKHSKYRDKIKKAICGLAQPVDSEDVAAGVGCSVANVRLVLRRLGVEYKRDATKASKEKGFILSKFDDGDEALIAGLIKAKEPFNSIADKFDVSVYALKKYCQAKGISFCR